MSKDDKNKKEEVSDPGRRKFVKNSGIFVGGVAGGSLLGGVFTGQLWGNDSDDEKKSEKTTPEEARMFFTRYEDFAVLQQATERIYPEDDNGPGAIKLGVPYFIDRQLAGQWGKNAKDYRSGPFKIDDTTDVKYQNVHARQTRGKIFLEGVRKINSVSRDRHDDTFDKLDEEQQDDILQDFEDDKVKMKSIPAEGFFELLIQATLEGAYSDPLYGGNRNMEGWKMKEYPGPVMSYADKIDSEEFVEMEPVSLTDYQQN